MQSEMFPGATMRNDSQDITGAYSHNDKHSYEANKSMKGQKKFLRQKVYFFIRDAGILGATSDEVEQAFDMSHQTISARITELKALGSIRNNGQKRKTRSGRNAGVLVV